MLSLKDFAAMEHVQFHLLKRIFGLRDPRHRVSYLDLIMWAESRGVCVYPLRILIKQRQIRYLGEMLRMEHDRTNHQLLHADIEGGWRYQGGQMVTYRGNLRKALRDFGFNLDRLYDIAQNEKVWNEAMEVGKKRCFTEWIKKRISTSTYQTSEITYEGSKVKRNTNEKLLARGLLSGATMIEDINVTSRRRPQRSTSNTETHEDVSDELYDLWCGDMEPERIEGGRIEGGGRRVE